MPDSSATVTMAAAAVASGKASLRPQNVGILAMEAYFPQNCLQQTALEEADDERDGPDDGGVDEEPHEGLQLRAGPRGTPGKYGVRDTEGPPGAGEGEKNVAKKQ